MRARSTIAGLFLMVGVAGCGEGEMDLASTAQGVAKAIPNNHPEHSVNGKGASYSTQGEIDLTDEFFQNQGINGRNCATCHVPEDGWSIRPETAQRFFDETDGLHPLFNGPLDGDRLNLGDYSTVEARRANFSMLLQGKFTRNVTPPGTREWDVVGASDPMGIGSVSPQRLFFFRRPLPTANFKSATVMWDAANTVSVGGVPNLRAGLDRQARGNVTGAQQGPPASDAVINEIVDYELAMSHAQLIVEGVGDLRDGANGGPEAQSTQALVAGRFDLFDGWATDDNPRRQAIFRGQELFNTTNAASGRRCGGCHNAANNGQNVNGTLFNTGASDPAFASADMAVYTLRRRSTGETMQTTDPGRGLRNGLWNDLNKFKTPNLRGLASRAPYYHNGIAADLQGVVDFYEASLGFDFTEEEEADLVAFMNAL